MDYEKIVDWLDATHALVAYSHLYWAWEVTIPAYRAKGTLLVSIDDKCLGWLEAVNLAMMRY